MRFTIGLSRGIRVAVGALLLPLPLLLTGLSEPPRARLAESTIPHSAAKIRAVGERESKLARVGTDESSPQSVVPSDEDTPATKHVILVVLDGLKWQDVFGLAPDAAGAMPTLRRFMYVDGAVVGAPERGNPMAASGPNYISLPGYVEMLTGHPSECQANECVLPRLHTVVDDLPGQSVILSSWETIGPIVRSEKAAVSSGRNFAFGTFDPYTQRDIDAAKGVDPAPGLYDFRPEALTAAIAIDVVRREAPQFLFIGFGETDEQAHRGEREKYILAMRAADAFLLRLETTLDETGLAASTAILVTTDHGRSDGFRDHGATWPESKRVWLVAKGAGIAARGPVADASERTLSNVAPTIRALLGVAATGDDGAVEPLRELTLR
ncbi:hypothetical protein BH09MYX1_BH09MYX1_05620 [soil metagenome]